MVGLIGDMINFLGVLCDLKKKEDEERELEEVESSKDKVLLYNEIIDVLRAIMHIYKKREEEERGIRRKLLLDLQKQQGNSQSASDFLD